MNKYLVGVYIVGKSGKRAEVTEFVDAEGKEEAGIKIRKMIEEEGWKYGGIDYIDLAD
jgi:hypothetical protein